MNELLALPLTPDIMVLESLHAFMLEIGSVDNAVFLSFHFLCGYTVWKVPESEIFLVVLWLVVASAVVP